MVGGDRQGGSRSHEVGSDISCIQIESDAADLAVFGFGCTLGRMTVVLCLPGISYQHYYWWTRWDRTLS